MPKSRHHFERIVTSWMVILLVVPSALAQEQQPPQLQAPANASQNKLSLFTAQNTRPFVGLESECWTCHGQAVNSERISWLPDSVYDGWIRRDEMSIWAKEDKHSEAFAVLLTDRTKTMAKLLSPPGGEPLKLHLDKRCLACHSGFPLHQLPEGEQPHLTTAEIEKDFRVTVGVSCEGCHGPSGDGQENAKGWYSPHQISKTWRFRSAEEKQNDFGYFDIHSCSAKVRLCVSCHVGKVALGRVVTHEMMAAGHPPLPGFEAAAFLAQQPPHWHDFAEKNAKLREEFAAQTGRPYDEAQLPVTKTILTGAVVSLAESLRLTAALCTQAQDDARQDIPTQPWPELANFACYACHHDLQRPAWRQERAAGGDPGRPMLFEWPRALLFVALDTAEIPREEVEPRLEAVHTALGKRPFGEPAELAAAASSAADWLDDQAKRLDAREFTREDAAVALRLICETAARQTLDYDSARQLVWAFQEIYRELKPKPQATEAPELVPSDSPAPEDRVLAALKPLEDMFILDLRKGAPTQKPILVSEKPREIIEVELERTLPPIADYDPKAFRAHFEELRKSLGAR